MCRKHQSKRNACYEKRAKNGCLIEIGGGFPKMDDCGYLPEEGVHRLHPNRETDPSMQEVDKGAAVEQKANSRSGEDGDDGGTQALGRETHGVL